MSLIEAPPKPKRPYVPLTHEQNMHKLARQTLNKQRQLRMPTSSRPRISPQKNMPKTDPAVLYSMRQCIENPEEHPNDFRYLFREVASGSYVWLNIQGQSESPLFANLFDACMHYARKGWEDATW